MNLLRVLKRNDTLITDATDEFVINRNEYIEFKNRQDVETWARPVWGDWAAQVLKDENRYAINDYVAGSKGINQFLRRNCALDTNYKDQELYKEYVNVIDDQLSKFRIPDNIVVYRFVDKVFLNDLGFMSTTLIYDVLANHIQFKNKPIVCKIYLSEGAKGAYFGFNIGIEEELLLPRGTSLAVFNIYRNYDGKEIYECFINQ